MSSTLPNQPDLASEFENAIQTTKRILSTGWLLISLFVALSLVYFSQAKYQSVILFALGAPALYFATFWVTSVKLEQFKLVPVILYCLFLPLLVEKYVSASWISIGLITTTAAVSAILFEKQIFAYVFVIFCVLAQYTFANSHITGISDTRDTLLLNSYFSSLWNLIIGFGSIIIANNYYKNSKKLDVELSQLESEFWDRSHVISKINLKDYINLKLHGTILNTLIVAQNMPQLLSYEKIVGQLRKEVSELENQFSGAENQNELKELLLGEIAFGNLQVEIQNPQNLSLPILDSGLIVELIREVVLNIKKHSNAKGLQITITSPSKGSVLITVREDLKLILNERELQIKAFAAMQSRSLVRLCKDSNSNYSVNSYATGSLLHILDVNLVDRDLNILTRVKKLRRESLATVIRNISLMSIAFALLAIPGFLSLGVPPAIIAITALTIGIHGFLVQTNRLILLLSILVTLLPLLIIPIVLLNETSCVNLEFLPWAVNTFLGAILFGAFSSSNVIFRWVPGGLMILEGLATNFYLPSECSNLLNGTTPGVIIILILAKNLSTFRSRNFRLDADLDGFLKAQSGANSTILKRVATARDKVLSDVLDFANRKEDLGTTANEIGRLINFVRSFLLCSEKFNNQFYVDLFSWISVRYDLGFDTSLELYEIGGYSNIANFEFGEFLREVAKVSQRSNMHLVITTTNRLLVEIRAEGDSVRNFEIQTTDQIN